MESVTKARETKPVRNVGTPDTSATLRSLEKWIKPLRLGVAPHFQSRIYVNLLFTLKKVVTELALPGSPYTFLGRLTDLFSQISSERPMQTEIRLMDKPG